MKSELEAEAANEAEMYDKMVCWCQTNEKEKKQAIADADAKDKELSSEIEARSARFGKLSTQIKELKKQIAKDTAASKEAMAIREGAAGSFRDEETDLVQTITNLKNAISVLGRHQGGSSLLQLSAPMASSLHALLRDVALKYDVLLADASHRSSTRSLSQTSFVSLSTNAKQGLGKALFNTLDKSFGASHDVPLKYAQRIVAQSSPGVSSAFLQSTQPNTYKSYSAHSDQIFGIMTQMLEEFEAELKTIQGDEVRATGDYDAMAKSKAEQIRVGKEKLDQLEADNADNQKALSDAKEDLELTRKQRSADVEFLRNLKLTCNDLDHQWEERSKTRSEEIKAVAEALAICTEDDNMDMLFKTVTLLQLQTAQAMRALRSHAADALRQAAQAPAFDADDLLSAWHSRSSASAVGAAGGPRAQLSSLAVMVQLDSFTKVKEMMEKMVTELKKEQEEEVKFKAYCTKELNDNEKATYAKTEEKKDLEAKIESLSAHISDLQSEIADARTQMSDTEVAIKKASENREKENAEFQTTVADQRATQEILKKALERLQLFYKKEAALLEKSHQTPPVQFNKYKNNAGASPVMGLIEQIIGDSATLEQEATAAEFKAQADYETFVKDSNNLIAELSAAVTAKTQAIGGAKLETADAESDHTSAVGELESLAQVEAELHAQCDFVLKNFAIRQKARLQEIEAISAAKAILSGERAQ